MSNLGKNQTAVLAAATTDALDGVTLSTIAGTAGVSLKVAEAALWRLHELRLVRRTATCGWRAL